MFDRFVLASKYQRIRVKYDMASLPDGEEYIPNYNTPPITIPMFSYPNLHLILRHWQCQEHCNPFSRRKCQQEPYDLSNLACRELRKRRNILSEVKATGILKMTHITLDQKPYFLITGINEL